ncbi:hypothetical protein L1987_14028 [Smallanthus sonchifolius]|uniref:Uncharacterized protein n=1 Tax=Smallanthus sonchifolius TaxID=185202 RepID=A0ACB9JIP9_9ASTR|nr:hypothetical protein L1987_14028 [Smallanthus sonchifolius]
MYSESPVVKAMAVKVSSMPMMGTRVYPRSFRMVQGHEPMVRSSKLSIDMEMHVCQILIIALQGSHVLETRIDGTVWGGNDGYPDVDVWAVCLHGPDDGCVLGLRNYGWTYKGKVVVEELRYAPIGLSGIFVTSGIFR